MKLYSRVKRIEKSMSEKKGCVIRIVFTDKVIERPHYRDITLIVPGPHEWAL